MSDMTINDLLARCSKWSLDKEALSDKESRGDLVTSGDWQDSDDEGCALAEDLAEALRGQAAKAAHLGQMLADVFGDPMTAMHTGGHFNCGEADTIGSVLVELGQQEAAETWTEGHAAGDDDPDDTHAHIHAEFQGLAPDGGRIAALVKEYVEANL